ncbi:hypothetical protein RJ639_023629 [Escallonia herrerae]|uniref:Uncharacterized protein n=1 Tax=Escallonia herrerae TaxID=1293975 RepID=A0AA88V2A4_9ASTE|nr:hypothetical protein RJ639_023629 [Escallonia herrerae]
MAVFKELVAINLIVATVFVSWVEARFVVEKSSISVIDPYDLRSKHDGAIGNFGVPDYGGSMVGSVVYAEKGSSGCNPFDGDKPFKSKSRLPTILLLDRGGVILALLGFILWPLSFLVSTRKQKKFMQM